jgi:hypothetical protein
MSARVKWRDDLKKETCHDAFSNTTCIFYGEMSAGFLEQTNSKK